MDGVEASGKLTFEGPERQPKYRIEIVPSHRRNKTDLPLSLAYETGPAIVKVSNSIASSLTSLALVAVRSVEARGPPLAGLTGEVHHGQTIFCDVDNPNQNRQRETPWATAAGVKDRDVTVLCNQGHVTVPANNELCTGCTGKFSDGSLQPWATNGDMSEQPT